MSQGMNDLLAGLSASLSAEEATLASLEAIICGEIITQRIERGMTQKQFAEFMEVSQSMVSKWEKGECNFTLQSLVKIASKLGLSLQSPIVPHTPAHIQSQATTVTFPGKWHTRATTPPVYQSTEARWMVLGLMDSCEAMARTDGSLSPDASTPVTIKRRRPSFTCS